MSDRAAGLLLFLPVPAVLWLLTRQPLGPWPSLGLGVALLLTHRLYARPFALSRARRRCLWCGGIVAPAAPALTLREPFGPSAWHVCSEAHLAPLRRTLGWAARHRRFLKVAILGVLGIFLVLSLACAWGEAPAVRADDAVAFFRLGIALSVLPFGWLASRGPAEAAGEALPFPVHIQALVGTRVVLWLFRLVGLWWLAAGIVHVTTRVA